MVDHFPSIKLHPSELHGYERNSRTHSAEQIEQICNSIKEWGFTNPIIIDESNMVIAGHGRLEAALQLKLDSVPCVQVSGWSDAQKRAYVLADNKLALNAGWDNNLLLEELHAIDEMGFNIELAGFDLDDLMDDVLGGEDEDVVPEPPATPVTVEGDVWLLGDHRLMCGDGTDKSSLQILMNSGSADLLVTDPPYNVGYTGKTKDSLTIKNDSMEDGDFRAFLTAAYSAADSVMREGASFYVWHADSEGFNFRAAAVDVGWKIRQCLVWVKNTMVLGRQDYQWKHEPCLYGWKDGASHYWGGDRKQTTVLDFDKPARNGEHPTMKPLELISYQIKNSSKRGWSVLDMFGGSGSTLIAAENLDRKCFIMELDPKYCDVIINRWQKVSAQKAVLEGDGRNFDELKAERVG